MEDLGNGGLMDQDAVIDYVLKAMTKELGDHLQGILLTGSRAMGTSDKYSDWDFFVVHDGNWRQRRLLAWNGEELELFLNPGSQILLEFDEDNSATVWMFVYGKIIVDDAGILTHLRDIARKKWESPRTPWSNEERDLWRYHVCDLLKDIVGCAQTDVAAASYLIGLILPMALEGYYRYHGWWQPKPKYLFGDFVKREPDIAKLAATILANGLPLEKRIGLLTDFVGQIMRPVGGCLAEWQTPREIVQSSPKSV